MPELIQVSPNGDVTIIPTGPVGPPGAQGPTGPQGPIGAGSGLDIGDAADVPSAGSVDSGYGYYAKDTADLYIKNGALGGGSWDIYSLIPNDVLWANTNGEVEFNTPTRSTDGDLVGGVIRNVSGIHIPWAYDSVATTEPNTWDPLLGTAFHVDWQMKAKANVSTYGPSVQSGYFGPRPVFNLEGLIEYWVNQTEFAFEPIGFGDFLRVKNRPGYDRILIPAWSLVSSRFIIADDGVVTLAGNDTNSGGAAFVDTKMLLTHNGGSMAGSEVMPTSFLSAMAVSGDVALDGRVGYDFMPVRPATNTPYNTEELAFFNSLGFPNADTDIHSIGLEIAFRARKKWYSELGLASPEEPGSDHAIGFWNGLGVVDEPTAVTLTSDSTTIPKKSSLIHLNASADRTLMAAPIIDDGIDGQRLRLLNVSAFVITLKGEKHVANTNLFQDVVLRPGDSIELMWHEGGDIWRTVSRGGCSMTMESDVDNDGRVFIGVGAGSGSMGVFDKATDAKPVFITGLIAGIGTGIYLGAGGAEDLDWALLRNAAGSALASGALEVQGELKATSGDLKVKADTDSYGQVDVVVAEGFGSGGTAIVMRKDPADTIGVMSMTSMNAGGWISTIGFGPGGTTPATETIQRPVAGGLDITSGTRIGLNGPIVRGKASINITSDTTQLPITHGIVAVNPTANRDMTTASALFTGVGVDGQEITVRNVNSGGFTMTITGGASSGLILSSAGAAVLTRYSSITFISDGTRWIEKCRTIV